MSREEVLLMCLFILIFVGQTAFFILNESTDKKVINEVNNMNKRILDEIKDIDRIEMYNKEIAYAENVNGVYHHNNFYCVYTKNRTSEEIQGTVEHEVLHALIGQDKRMEEHFCE